MATVFAAKYPGKCGACKEPFDVRDSVMYNEDNTLVHFDCENYVSDHVDTLEPVRPICNICFMEKPVNGECCE